MDVIQSKLTINLKVHNAPIEITKVNKTVIKPNTGTGVGKTGSLAHCWWRYKMFTDNLENSLAVSYKILHALITI